MHVLSPNDAMGTLTHHLPAGTSKTLSTGEVWDAREVAEFQYQHLLDAGYVVCAVDADDRPAGPLAAYLREAGELLHALAEQMVAAGHPEAPVSEVASLAEAAGAACGLIVDAEEA